MRLGLVAVQRLQMLDDGEEEAAQLGQGGEGFRGARPGHRHVATAGGDDVQRLGQPHQAGRGVGAQMFGAVEALRGCLPGLLVGLLGVRLGGAVLRQQGFQPTQTPLAGEHQRAKALAAFGFVKGRAGLVVRVQQGDDGALPGPGELDQLLGAGEQLDDVAERRQGGILRRQRVGNLLVLQRPQRVAHVGETAIEHWRGFLHRGAGAGRVRRRRGLRVGRQHRLEDAQHAAGARRGVLLPIAQVLGGQPAWRRVLQGRGRALERGQGAGVSQELRLVAGDRAEHRHRIPQLLAGALQFREGGVGAAVAALALQPSQAPAGVAQ